ncbi:hypothetical protein Q1695_005980 [Nippostrongylus brasiliensis]|nr:hypothetical protein Q1695_005980 [Nippostrongylus brasiliensis]
MWSSALMVLVLIRPAVLVPQSWLINENSPTKLLYGDMILTPMQQRRYGDQKNSVRGVSRKENSFNRWKDNIIPYKISTQYTNDQARTIRDSLDELERMSCFRFVERSNEKDYLSLVPLDGCYSFVGKIGGAQVVSLARDCVADYIIWHEVMHAIGFEHEHQRPDRDNYIRVEYKNVQQGQLLNFEKLSPYEVDYPDGYDYKSIMHYDAYAFGRRDPKSRARLATMIPLLSGVTLEDNMKMSPTDIVKLNRLGRCNNRGMGGSWSGEQESSTCEDHASNCRTMKKNGMCSMSFYHQIMLSNCAKTCQFCSASPVDERSSAAPAEELSTTSSSPECTDKDPRCEMNVRNGFCKSPFYTLKMKISRCAKSCNLCSSA